MKYRKKPVIIDAIQWNGIRLDFKDMPDWFAFAFSEKRINQNNETLAITTLEGVMLARPNDWIIQGIEGEIYSCKPNIFEATYKKVEE